VEFELLLVTQAKVSFNTQKNLLIGCCYAYDDSETLKGLSKFHLQLISYTYSKGEFAGQRTLYHKQVYIEIENHLANYYERH